MSLIVPELPEKYLQRPTAYTLIHRLSLSLPLYSLALQLPPLPSPHLISRPNKVYPNNPLFPTPRKSPTQPNVNGRQTHNGQPIRTVYHHLEVVVDHLHFSSFSQFRVTDQRKVGSSTHARKHARSPTPCNVTGRRIRGKKERKGSINSTTRKPVALRRNQTC